MSALQIISGGSDRVVPPVNAEFLHERLPKSKLDLIDAAAELFATPIERMSS